MTTERDGLIASIKKELLDPLEEKLAKLIKAVEMSDEDWTNKLLEELAVRSVRCGNCKFWSSGILKSGTIRRCFELQKLLGVSEPTNTPADFACVKFKKGKFR